MDTRTAQLLNRLTTDFYRNVSASFSQTRQNPWEGWERVAQEASDVVRKGMSVIDMGCGNLRFEAFLAKRISAPGSALANTSASPEGRFPSPAGQASLLAEEPLSLDEQPTAPAEQKNARAEKAADVGKEPAHLHVRAFDNCPALAVAEAHDLPAAVAVDFRELDIAATLLAEERGLETGAGAEKAEGEAAGEMKAKADTLSLARIVALACGQRHADLAVAFGFMHHLPRYADRRATLQALARNTRAGGYVAASFWQPLNSERIAEKARIATARGCAAWGIEGLGEHDLLLGWQNDEDIYRFCHHFDEAEIDRLAVDVAPLAQEVARFSADGKSRNLNRYLVLRVR